MTPAARRCSSVEPGRRPSALPLAPEREAPRSESSAHGLAEIVAACGSLAVRLRGLATIRHMRKHNESILSRRTTSALSSILLAATVMLAGVGVIPTLATPRASAQTPTISWSVRAYANNARVLPPLIGDFQLGTATFEGNGTFSVSGAADGSIADRDVPLISRYRSSSLAVRALSGTFSDAVTSSPP